MSSWPSSTLRKGKRLQAEGDRPALGLYKKMGPIIRRALDDEWQAVQAFQPDLMLFQPKMLGSYHIAEKLQIPLWLALPLPPFYAPTRLPNPMFSGVRLGGWFNRLSYRLMYSPVRCMPG